MTGIVMATMLEAGPFIRGMGLAEIPGGPFPVYRGADAILAISGIGKVNAAVAVAYLACAHSPSLVLNLGAAGCTRA
ncbi:MAG TPA: 5'-nucleosidase, partial [Spirochaetota bacterium]|nr:5'-nucleosidase [Spirochaetota bacterium]